MLEARAQRKPVSLPGFQQHARINAVNLLVAVGTHQHPLWINAVAILQQMQRIGVDPPLAVLQPHAQFGAWQQAAVEPVEIAVELGGGDICIGVEHFVDAQIDFLVIVLAISQPPSPILQLQVQLPLQLAFRMCHRPRCQRCLAAAGLIQPGLLISPDDFVRAIGAGHAQICSNTHRAKLAAMLQPDIRTAIGFNAPARPPACRRGPLHFW